MLKKLKKHPRKLFLIDIKTFCNYFVTVVNTKCNNCIIRVTKTLQAKSKKRTLCCFAQVEKKIDKNKIKFNASVAPAKR